jgi:hypothetical protein
MTEKTEYTLAEWLAEATRRFGPEKLDWKFVCYGCGHVQSPRDFLRASSIASGIKDPINEAYQECIGRYIGGVKWIEMKKGDKGPCDYAAFGLFSTPIKVTKPDGSVVRVFAFAEVP